MTLSDLQKFLENNIPGACLPVDLLKIAKSIGYRRNLPKTGTRIAYANSPLTLVVDGECCLDRLYGGFFSDWICGGQWNRMVQFLAVLIQTVQNNNIELAVFFNGTLEQQRLGEWAQSQNDRRKHINSVLRHVSNKGTPPPKIWWVAPTGLRTCLRMALRHLGIQVVNTMDDHHQEVIAFCRENNYHGLMAEDAEYIIFDPPRYFSSHQLKLTYKGSLETKEFILDEVEKGLNLPRNYFCFLATLLGNYLLTPEDLAGFYGTIISGYDKEQTTQEEIIRAVTKFITHSCDVNNLMTIGAQIFGSVSDHRVVKFKESVQYFLNGTKDGFLQYKPFPPGRRDMGMSASQYRPPEFQKTDDEKLKNNAQEIHPTEPFHPVIDSSPNLLPQIPHEVTRTASERHQKGLMCPWVYQVINQGEVKFEPCLHDENCEEFPNALRFYRPIRQNIYAILFNYHHYAFMSRKAKEEGQKSVEVPEIKIREWVYSKDNPYKHFELVDAVPIGWAVPTVQRLWFGAILDDKKRRLRAFLSCLNSDSPLMLHTGYVPQHMIIMATVLRYLVSGAEYPVLKKQEFDSFLITAFSRDLTNTQYLQDMQVPVINSRGAQLASFFMMGVEMTLFANDACGSPIPWPMCCPWLFFDGKLFHSILLKASCSRNLIDVCEGDSDLAAKVNRCRHAILEGLNPLFVGSSGGTGTKHPREPFVPMPPVPSVPFFHNSGGYRGKGRSGPPPPNVQGNHRPDSLYSRGGQLHVAGVVVGSWGPNFGTGRGGRGPNASLPIHGPGRNDMPMRLPKPSPRGRPAVLAKRRTFKRRDVRPIRTRPQAFTEFSSTQQSSSSVENGFVTESPSNPNENFTDFANDGNLFPEDSNLIPFDSDSFNQTNNGLKSPDSGVNVSILE